MGFLERDPVTQYSESTNQISERFYNVTGDPSEEWGNISGLLKNKKDRARRGEEIPK